MKEHKEPCETDCGKCDLYYPQGIVAWEKCRHPGRYDIAEPTEEEILRRSMNPEWAASMGETFAETMALDILPPNYTDKGCPRNRGSMFKTIIGDNKQAEVEFRDQEKYRSLPGLALPAIGFLDEYLTKKMLVGEWGSGASTLFFAMRCQFVSSIEHSPEWAEKTAAAMEYRLDAKRTPRETPADIYFIDVPKYKAHWIQLIEPQAGFDPDFGSHQPGYESVNFRSYVETVEGWTDEECDVMLVDGRARCACLKAAQPKVKPGGLLILDDSQRPQYHRAMAEIDWPVIHFEGCIPYYKHGRTVRTTIWVKG